MDNSNNIDPSALQNLWSQDPFYKIFDKSYDFQKPLDRCKECSYNILRHEDAIVPI